jgi:hypothetical protein
MNKINNGYVNYNGYKIPSLDIFIDRVNDFKNPLLGYSDLYVIHPKYGYRVEYYPDDGNKIIKAFQAAFKKIPKSKYIQGTATKKGSFKIFVKRPEDYYNVAIALLDVNTNESVDLAAEFLENVGFEIGYT